MTLKHFDWLGHHAFATPGARCWTDLHSGRSFTFAEAQDRCHRLALHLAACGVAKGDRVAMLAMNSTDGMEVHSACAKLGAIFLPLNWRLAAPELDFILGDAEPRILIHDTAMADLAGALTVAVPVVIETGGGGQASAYEDAIAGASGELAPVELTHDDIWTIMYTSGTTGHPKGAPNTYGMTFTNAINLSAPLRMDCASACLTVLPLFHTGGLNCFSTVMLHNGGHSVIVRAFDPGEVLRVLGDPSFGVTHMLGVPANYLFMAQHGDFRTTDFSRLVCAGVGGAPTPVPLLKTYAEVGLTIVQAFGMTETSPAVSLQSPETAAAKPGSAGRCVLHGELKILREDGAPADVDEVGALWVRGPNITPGYWKRPEANKTEFVDGWFNTGDAARLDSDGDLWIVDRWKDMYISGGENVYPAEVENVLFALDGIRDGAIVGAPDEKWGEIGVAWCVLEEGSTLTEDDILGHFQGKLARFKLPARVRFIDELPRNATGKVLKRELRDM